MFAGGCGELEAFSSSGSSDSTALAGCTKF